MQLTIADLKALIHQLEEARRASTGPRVGHYCSEPVLNTDGKPYRLEAKPNAREGGRFLVEAGHKIERHNGIVYVQVPLGMHGRSALVIDPETGKVSCAACAKTGYDGIPKLRLSHTGKDLGVDCWTLWEVHADGTEKLLKIGTKAECEAVMGVSTP